MNIFKKVLLTVTAGLLISAVSALTWSVLPVTTDRSQPDPAVIYANQNSHGGPAFSESYFEYNDKTLHYVEAGQGDIVLFFHGFPSFWYSLIRPMQVLKNSHRVIAIDGIGKGLSDVPTELDAYTLEAMSAHIIALLDHLGANKVHVVGHDWGTALAFGLAQRHPERIKSAVGMSAPPQSVLLELLTNSDKQRQTFSYVDYFKQANPLLLMAMNAEQRLWQSSFEPLVLAGHMTAEEGLLFREESAKVKRVNAHINWYRANLPSFDNITERDYWPARKARIDVPALFIWGKDDQLISDDTIDELQSVAAQLQLLPLRSVGHRPQFENDDLVINAIQKFLAN